MMTTFPCSLITTDGVNKGKTLSRSARLRHGLCHQIRREERAVKEQRIRFNASISGLVDNAKVPKAGR